MSENMNLEKNNAEDNRVPTTEDIFKRENTTALAFLGDAVYELYIRDYVLKTGQCNADILHRMAVKYVRAEAQADAVRYMLNNDNILTAEETALVKRARNKKSTSKSRSAGPVSYKLATAFEALVGALYRVGERERCREIMEIAIKVTEERGR